VRIVRLAGSGVDSKLPDTYLPHFPNPGSSGQQPLPRPHLVGASCWLDCLLALAVMGKWRSFPCLSLLRAFRSSSQPKRGEVERRAKPKARALKPQRRAPPPPLYCFPLDTSLWSSRAAIPSWYLLRHLLRPTISIIYILLRLRVRVDSIIHSSVGCCLT
jgi:hypothetical protein